VNQIAWLATCRPGLNLGLQKFMAGAGCTYCNLTGYRGRVAVYELLEIDRTLADAVGRGDLEGFTRTARGSAGYLPLAQGAIDYALAGVTSLAEAMAVGGGLEELTDIEAAAPLEDSIVATLLEQRA
jgi:MSHA biogenesis protein MshE